MHLERRYGKSTRMFAAIKAEAVAGGGVPARRVVLYLRGEKVIWEPTGEVKTLTRAADAQSLIEKAIA